MKLDVEELYQHTILEHYKNPKNEKRLTSFERFAEVNNKLCGDKIELFLRIEEQVVVEIGFQSEGCAIVKASASMMSEHVLLQNISEIQQLAEMFRSLWSGESNDFHELKDLNVFSHLKTVPTRIQCAELPWIALQDAISSKEKKE